MSVQSRILWVACLVSFSVLAVASPPNDDFANAVALAGSFPLTASGNNSNATVEIGEPDYVGATVATHSVWWKWTADTTTDVRVRVSDSSIPVIFGVYTGASVGTLTNVMGPGGIVPVASGTTYYFSLDGLNGSEGDVALEVDLAFGAPDNDNFNDRTVLGGSSFSVDGDNEGATMEEGEDNHGSTEVGASIWYSWTAPASAAMELDTLLSGLEDTVLAVYTGSVVSNLTLIAENDDYGDQEEEYRSFLTFDAIAGTEYQIAVAGYAGGRGLVTLRLALGEAGPVNDFFADAIAVSGSSVSVLGTTVNATLELNEPDHDPAVLNSSSVWWSWQSSNALRVEVDTFGSNFDTILGVYTGSSIDSLTLVAQNNKAAGTDQSWLSFDAEAGETYWIAVDGQGGDEGAVSLNLFAVSPEITSLFRLQNGMECEVVWNSVPGRTYSVHSSTNLVDWLFETNVVASTSESSSVFVLVPENQTKNYFVSRMPLVDE